MLIFIFALQLELVAIFSNTPVPIPVLIPSYKKKNYKSIAASKTMIEALEREDSGVLLLMLGRWEEGRQIIDSSDSLFQESFSAAASNITIEGEKAQIEMIDKRYKEFHSRFEKPIVGTNKEGDINWYFDEVHTDFLEVKAAINKLMSMNDETMYSTSSGLRGKANRAIMPAVVALTL